MTFGALFWASGARVLKYARLRFLKDRLTELPAPVPGRSSRGLIFIAGLALAGCSAPAVDYRLRAEPGPVVSGAAMAVSVRGVNVPGFLDQNGIAKLSGAYRYDSYPNDVWAEPLADMLQAVMVQELGPRLPAAVVVASGGAIGVPVQMVVEINVLRFDPDPDGRIDLDAQISVRRGGDNRVVRTVDFQRLAAPAAGPLAEVAAMSGLWAQAADAVAALLAQADAASG
jgi:uncharacterized lipoprotein YmbA